VPATEAHFESSADLGVEAAVSFDHLDDWSRLRWPNNVTAALRTEHVAYLMRINSAALHGARRP